jgi:hypothetical protein
MRGPHCHNGHERSSMTKEIKVSTKYVRNRGISNKDGQAKYVSSEAQCCACHVSIPRTRCTNYLETKSRNPVKRIPCIALTCRAMDVEVNPELTL